MFSRKLPNYRRISHIGKYGNEHSANLVKICPARFRSFNLVGDILREENSETCLRLPSKSHLYVPKVSNSRLFTL